MSDVVNEACLPLDWKGYEVFVEILGSYLGPFCVALSLQSLTVLKLYTLHLYVVLTRHRWNCVRFIQTLSPTRPTIEEYYRVAVFVDHFLCQPIKIC